MPLASELQAIDGVQELYDWFGYWPSFHDAEIVSLCLNRRGTSLLALHTWETTKELDEKGYCVITKELVVEFILEGIEELDVDGFSHQNVIFGLDVKKTDAGFRIVLEPCYGLAGSIGASKVAVRIKPGKPSDRQV